MPTFKTSTRGPSIDLGQLQAAVESARRLFKSTTTSLEKAQIARDNAKVGLDVAEQALRDGFRTVQG